MILYIIIFLVSGFAIGQEKTNTTQTESKSIYSYTFKINSWTEPQTGQERFVNGIITDHNNEPLPGVTILIDKTHKGTHTDFEGKYSIAAKPTDTLVFSYPGFKTQKIKAEKKELNIKMEEYIILEIVPPYFNPKRNNHSLLIDPRKNVTEKEIENANKAIPFHQESTFLIGEWKEIEYQGNNGADDYLNKIENGQTFTFEKDSSLLIQKDGTTTLGSYEIFPHNEHTLKLHILSSKKEFHYLISNQENPDYIYLTPVTSDYQFICKEGCSYVYEKIK